MPFPRLRFCSAVLGWVGLLLVTQRASSAEILRIEASGTNGLANIIRFALAKERPALGELRLSNGSRIAYQGAPGGEALAIIPEHLLRLGESYDATIKAPAGTGRGKVSGERVGSTIRLSLNSQEAIRYQAEPGELPRPDIKPIFRRGGYLHPILSPAGHLVSDDFPPNHIHHHGVWSPWTKTTFEGRHPDFWNMGDAKGRVDFVALDSVESGPVFGGFQSRHRFVDMLADPEKTALNEAWNFRLYGIATAGGRPCRIFDLEITQTCSTTSPLELPKYHYGGLGFRGNRAWDGVENCDFLTSNGETNRIAGNESRGRWCWIGGRVDGETTGIAVLCHPANFRAPQPMRLHPTEPFFCFAASQMGDWSINPGQPYIARYRFVVADGAPNREWLDRLWEGYANPPRVTVSR